MNGARRQKDCLGVEVLVVGNRVGVVMPVLATFSELNKSCRIALHRRAWAILIPVRALLQRRLADNTLLPGTIKEEEVTLFARMQASIYKANNEPVPSEVVLQGSGVVPGYSTLLDAVFIRWLC